MYVEYEHEPVREVEVGFMNDPLEKIFQILARGTDQIENITRTLSTYGPFSKLVFFYNQVQPRNVPSWVCGDTLALVRCLLE